QKDTNESKEKSLQGGRRFSGILSFQLSYACRPATILAVVMACPHDAACGRLHGPAARPIVVGSCKALFYSMAGRYNVLFWSCRADPEEHQHQTSRATTNTNAGHAAL